MDFGGRKSSDWALLGEESTRFVRNRKIPASVFHSDRNFSNRSPVQERILKEILPDDFERLSETMTILSEAFCFTVSVTNNELGRDRV